nr:unnamed protein product [Spirometra erinaceieuropaei]
MGPDINEESSIGYKIGSEYDGMPSENAFRHLQLLELCSKLEERTSLIRLVIRRNVEAKTAVTGENLVNLAARSYRIITKMPGNTNLNH